MEAGFSQIQSHLPNRSAFILILLGCDIPEKVERDLLAVLTCLIEWFRFVYSYCYCC